MTSRIPIIPTAIVLAASATMVWLGFWQLGRSEEKAELLARYETASTNAGTVTFPDRGEGEDALFRRSNVDCERVVDIQPVAGTAANGAKGWAIRAICDTGSDRLVTVDLGFAQYPEVPDYEGGETVGIVAPGPRLVADPPEAGLQPLAKPCRTTISPMPGSGFSSRLPRC